VKGQLVQQGWGAALGFPALVLDGGGKEVNGFLFSSENLSNFWDTLDAFEGEQYERVLVDACLHDGKVVAAYVYVLKRG
jgi:gamma-glutamylcyclotransferase (GGCT)/AIG2-like uncharacterized protein YtfP